MAAMKVFALFLLAAAACNASPRIVGGDETSIDKYPSLVQVEFLGIYNNVWSQSCAGNILTSLHVLSAAHCFDGTTYPSAEYRQVRAGATARGSGGQVYQILRAINHPSYGTNGYDGDITVVRLSSTVVFSDTVAVGTIVIQNWDAPAGAAVAHAGWGFTEQGGPSSDVLLEVTKFIVDRAECARQYQAAPWPRDVTENMICSGTPEGGKDVCRGDEGGALYMGGTIIGIASWGQGCGQPEFPGVSTSVSPYSQWIVANAAS